MSGLGEARAEPRIYRPRWVRAAGVRSWARWRFKLYTIALDPEGPPAALVDAAVARARTFVEDHRTPHETYGVGFAAIHAGATENQLIVDRWANENELHHTVFVSSREDPTAFRPPPPTNNCVCVWELAIQSFERSAWLASFHAPEGPAIDAYLEATVSGRI